MTFWTLCNRASTLLCLLAPQLITRLMTRVFMLIIEFALHACMRVFMCISGSSPTYVHACMTVSCTDKPGELLPAHIQTLCDSKQLCRPTSTPHKLFPSWLTTVKLSWSRQSRTFVRRQTCPHKSQHYISVLGPVYIYIYVWYVYCSIKITCLLSSSHTRLCLLQLYCVIRILTQRLSQEPEGFWIMKQKVGVPFIVRHHNLLMI